MRAILIAALYLAALAAACPCHAASVVDFPAFSLTSGPTTLLPGRIYTPPEAMTEPRPLILFMHGSGESGTNNLGQINANIDNLLAEAKQRGAYLYAPQTNGGWENETITDRVKSMVDRALAEKNVDPRRVYVTGLSMGGGGTWNMLNRYGELFAAGVPICAVGPDNDYLPANLLGEPIWAFHARSDSTVNVAATREMYNSLISQVGEPLPTYLTLRERVDSYYESAALDLRFTEWFQGGHGIWGRVYQQEPMYDWLFAHTSVPEPASWAMAGVVLVIAVRNGRRSFSPGLRPGVAG